MCVMDADCVEMTIQHDAGTESAIIGVDAVLKVKNSSAHPTDEDETRDSMNNSVGDAKDQI